MNTKHVQAVIKIYEALKLVQGTEKTMNKESFRKFVPLMVTAAKMLEDETKVPAEKA